jgi:hypothetical protein
LTLCGAQFSDATPFASPEVLDVLIRNDLPKISRDKLSGRDIGRPQHRSGL